MSRIEDAVSVADHGIILAIEVTPGSKQNVFPAGFNPWRKTIACRVTAPAMEGKANAAVIAVIAESLGLPLHAVCIRHGAASPIKKVLIEGCTKADLVHLLKEKI